MQAGWTQEDLAPELVRALAASAARVPHPSGPVIEEIRSRVLVQLASADGAWVNASSEMNAAVLALAGLIRRR